MKKTFLSLLLLLLAAVPVLGQGTVQGQETTISYSGTNAQLTNPNTPLTNLAAGTGTNTFILPIANPTVAVRVYITNNTVNGCNSPVSIQMFSSTDSTVTSFNNSLANWQTVLLQSPTSSALVPAVTTSIPASSAVFITSTAIVSPKVAIQVVSTAGVCATTTVEVTAVVTQVAVGSPLISTLTNNPLAGANQVQGVGANQASANTINPVLISGAQPAVNSAFLNTGLDSISNFSSLNTGGGGAITLQVGTVPPLTQGGTGELAIGFFNFASDLGTPTFNAGWTCMPSISCGGNQKAMYLQSATSGYPWIEHWQNASNNIQGTTVVMTFKSGSVGSATGFVGSPVPKTVTAGDPLLVLIMCTVNPTPCSVTSVVDSLSNNFQQIAGTTNFPNGAINNQGLFIWGTTNVTNGGADSVTITAAGNTLSYMVIELTGAAPSSVNQPQTFLSVDQLGNLVVRQDAQAPSQWTCTVTLTTNTTTQCQTIPQAINGVTVRNYVTDFQINTTTAGTATAISLVDGTGANCATAQLNISAINYPNTTVGIQNLLSFRTPFVTPTGTAICVKQAGTTAGTSVVELHGFIAP